ncbi:MAG: SCP2 sterol-binding domain-containing protein, partial [Solirubrobacterales bacterium]
MAVVDAEERRTRKSRPPAGLVALIERFDPDVIDLPTGSARIRLTVGDEDEWDAVIDDRAIELQPASESRPDALLSADAATWEQIVRDVRGGMAAFREGRMRVRQNLHLG